MSESVKRSYKQNVEMVAKIVRKEGRVDKYRLAYYLDRDPTATVRYMKTVAEIYPHEFTYENGELIAKEEVKKEAKNSPQE